MYRCGSPLCKTCSYDNTNPPSGTQICTECIPGYIVNPSNTCTSLNPPVVVVCGDGLLTGNETCDDLKKGGC
jgi:hypothetical protein